MVIQKVIEDIFNKELGLSLNETKTDMVSSMTLFYFTKIQLIHLMLANEHNISKI